MNNDKNDLVGLIPAAGYANRVAGLPCSKEIYPIIHPDGDSTVVSFYLMESLKHAGVEQVYVILREGKWDIPEYYKNGSKADLPLAHIVTEATPGVPFTLDKAYPFIRSKKVLFGFPDILFKPKNAFVSLLEKQKATEADLVLGLFKAENPQKMDMVDRDTEQERVKDIIIKPEHTSLTYTWILAVWTSSFTHFLHKYVEANSDTHHSPDGKELHVGDIFREAIQAEIRSAYVEFDEGVFIDIGTPEDLAKVNSLKWLD